MIIFSTFVASRLSGLNEIPPVQVNASQLTGYQKNEFDTSKFTSGLVYRNHSQYDLPSFGLDPDEPIFVTQPYGPGGLKRQDYYQRPYSALSGSNKAAPSWGRPERPDSSLQVKLFLDRKFFSHVIPNVLKFHALLRYCFIYVETE